MTRPICNVDVEQVDRKAKSIWPLMMVIVIVGNGARRGRSSTISLPLSSTRCGVTEMKSSNSNFFHVFADPRNPSLVSAGPYAKASVGGQTLFPFFSKRKRFWSGVSLYAPFGARFGNQALGKWTERVQRSRTLFCQDEPAVQRNR